MHGSTTHLGGCQTSAPWQQGTLGRQPTQQRPPLPETCWARAPAALSESLCEHGAHRKRCRKAARSCHHSTCTRQLAHFASSDFHVSGRSRVSTRLLSPAEAAPSVNPNRRAAGAVLQVPARHTEEAVRVWSADAAIHQHPTSSSHRHTGCPMQPCSRAAVQPCTRDTCTHLPAGPKVAAAAPGSAGRCAGSAAGSGRATSCA